MATDYRRDEAASRIDVRDRGAERAEVERLALRIAELAKALGLSRRSIERARSAGRFPPPDLTVGKVPLWKPETIRAWVDGGGA